MKKVKMFASMPRGTLTFVRRGMEAPNKLTQKIIVDRGMGAPYKITKIRKIVEKYISAAYKLKTSCNAQICNKMHQVFVAYPYPL